MSIGSIYFSSLCNSYVFFRILKQHSITDHKLAFSWNLLFTGNTFPALNRMQPTPGGDTFTQVPVCCILPCFSRGHHPRSNGTKPCPGFKSSPPPFSGFETTIIASVNVCFPSEIENNKFKPRENFSTTLCMVSKAELFAFKCVCVCVSMWEYAKEVPCSSE